MTPDSNAAPAIAPMPADTAAAFAAGLSFKILIIDAICGVGFPSQLIATQCEQVGLARYLDDPFHPTFEWRRDVLARNPVEKLQALYEGLCEAREENLKVTQFLIGTRGEAVDHAN